MRTSTFENVGTDVSHCKTSEEVLSEARLSYNVVTRRIKYEGTDGSLRDYPDKVLTMNETNGKVYGVVSEKYTVCQNKDAFNFIDYIGHDDTGFEFVKAGEVSSGKGKGLIYIIARISETTLMGDTITPYIIFQNSHDGLASVRATITPLRIVCQNQFNLAFKKSSNTVRIIHAPQMNERLFMARSMMRDVRDYMQTFKCNAEQLVMKKVEFDNVVKLFNQVFQYDPNTMTKRQENNYEKNRTAFINCYKHDDNQNFVGTAWGVINGAADYLTHYKGIRKPSDETMFVNTTFLSMALNQFFSMVSEI